MLVTDIVLIVALAVAVYAWWRRGMASRTTVLTIASAVALVAGIAGLLDDRWQAGIGTALAALFLLIVLIARLRKTPTRTTWPYFTGPLFTLLALAASLLLYWFPMPDLPPPSGDHSVGVLDFELVDASRKGIIAAGPDEPRRLLVRVWYPAGTVEGLEPRPYFTDAEVDTMATGLGSMYNAPFFFKYTKHVGTNSYENAPLLAGASDLPVIIYSHGYGSFLNQNTVLMEELASHGYLVFSVQHTYDSAPTPFPDGDVAWTDPKLAEELLATFADGVPQELKDAFTGADFGIRRNGHRQNYENSIAENQRIAARSAPIWVADRTFVHDALQQGQVPVEVAEVVAAGAYADTGQIGMSFGGSTTGGVCMIDPRCAAAVNLDGGDYHFTPFNRNIPAPFLMFYSDYQKIAEQVSGEAGAVGHGYNDFAYERHETAGLRGDVHRLQVRDVAHLGVSDFALFIRNPVRTPLLGKIDADAILGIQNDFVRGFFDKHVRGVNNDFPAAQYAKHATWVVPDDVSDLRQWWLDEHPRDRTERVVLDTSHGDIELAVYPERAPLSARNFLAYVDGGHYDGASFYRVAARANGAGIGIVQGGLAGMLFDSDPEELGDWAPPLPPIAHETTDATGIGNARGTIAYARLEPGSASSEFFINLSDNPVLDTGDTSRNPDGQGYAAFGRVLRGMRVLEGIRSLPADRPTDIELMRGQLLRDPVTIRRAYRVN